VIPIHGLHGRDGSAHHAELTVEIILHDITLRPLCGPAQQRLPAGGRHDGTKGKVVGRGHVGDLNALSIQPIYV